MGGRKTREGKATAWTCSPLLRVRRRATARSATAAPRNASAPGKLTGPETTVGVGDVHRWLIAQSLASVGADPTAVTGPGCVTDDVCPNRITEVDATAPASETVTARTRTTRRTVSTELNGSCTDVRNWVARTATTPKGMPLRINRSGQASRRSVNADTYAAARSTGRP